MFRILIPRASHSLSDERTEYLVKDRRSFMRFLGLSLADRVPDANAIWNFREAPTRARIDGVPAVEALFRRSDARLRAAGYIAMGGRIVDVEPLPRRRQWCSDRWRNHWQLRATMARVVAAPKRRDTEDEKRALREGRIPEGWAKKPAKLRRKEFANGTPSPVVLEPMAQPLATPRDIGE